MLASIGAMLLGIARYHDLRAFDTAPACASSVPAATCRMTVSATIQEVKITTGKHSWYGVRISGPDDVSGTYRFPDDNALVETANIGDDVTAVMWHGDVVEMVTSSPRRHPSTATGSTSRRPSVPSPWRSSYSWCTPGTSEASEPTRWSRR